MKRKIKRKANTMHEVLIVYKRPILGSMPKVRRSLDVDSILRNFINLETIDFKEHFWVLLLNNDNQVIGISEIAKGTTTHVSIDMKEIFQLVLKTNATGIIISHNHPSGKLKASASDKQLTKKIKTIADLFSVSLIDHIIITSESYYSFSDDGIL